MLETMRHRGPDGEGLAKTPLGLFGHLRLAIVDVARGAQPIYNEDGSVGVVFNGEIYNYLELRRGLQAKGHQFVTETDTEVLVHLFEEEGTASFARLIGMFALAIFTPEAAYLVRDQVGIKPLYYYQDGRRTLFASELKALLAVPGLDLEPSEIGLRHYLTFRYCAGQETIFRHIRKLPPAHYLKLTARGSRLQRYDSLPGPTEPMGTTHERMEALRETMLEVVASQLMGEVPIGLTLSGGLDSSAIAYCINHLGAKPETFNIGFPSVNEFEFSEAVARAFNLNHTAVLMAPSELAGYLPKYVRAIDEPLADAACLPLYKLCETIREQVTVVLSGEGGDEVFAGYPQYWQTAANYPTASEKSFRFFLERSWYFLGLDELFLSRRRAEFPARETFKGRIQQAMSAYDLHTWVPENLMMKADKILMAHSLEGRFPFLDLRVLRLAASLPQSETLGPGQPGPSGKWLLRELMTDLLPRNVIKRPKMGFSVPIPELLLSIKGLVQDTLRASGILDLILDRRAIIAVVDAHFDGRQTAPLLVWTLFILHYWVGLHGLAPGRHNMP